MATTIRISDYILRLAHLTVDREDNRVVADFRIEPVVEESQRFLLTTDQCLALRQDIHGKYSPSTWQAVKDFSRDSMVTTLYAELTALWPGFLAFKGALPEQPDAQTVLPDEHVGFLVRARSGIFGQIALEILNWRLENAPDGRLSLVNG
jgi:hypothetical protein